MYRINCGGPDYTDVNGELWSADFLYNFGGIFSTTDPIRNTNDPIIYQTERFDTGNPGPIYSLPLFADDDYLVNLYFADIYTGTETPGSRVFNVSLESLEILSYFDIDRAVGWETALIVSSLVRVSDGSLDIFVKSIVNFAKFSAIEVLGRSPSLSSASSGTAGNLASASMAGSSPTSSSALPWTVPLMVAVIAIAVVVLVLAVRHHRRKEQEQRASQIHLVSGSRK